MHNNQVYSGSSTPASGSAGERIRRYINSRKSQWQRMMMAPPDEKIPGKRNGSRQRRIQSLANENEELKREIEELKRFLVELGTSN